MSADDRLAETAAEIAVLLEQVRELLVLRAQNGARASGCMPG
jgi:hypothetical protein